MILAKNICYSYKLGNDALKNISFHLEPGSFNFICGPSGAGKTTLFKCLYLDIIPTKGELKVFGRDVSTMSSVEIANIRRRMGLVFQTPDLVEHLTVRENVLLPLTFNGTPTKEQTNSVVEILNWVGIDRLDDFPTNLSSGERQRVSIARAVVTRPKILIADEPTGNLDNKMGVRIIHLLKELNKLGTTILIVTHNQSLINQFDAPCLYIENGELKNAEK